MSKLTDQKDLSSLGSNHKTKKKNGLMQNDDDDSGDDLVKGTLDIEYEEDELEKDWSEVIKLNKKNLQMIIPKRGEKDYEPDGTDIQELLLYKARKAMFDALSNSVRGTTVKHQVKAVYNFDKHKALVLNPKGAFLQTMGHITKNGEFWLDFMEFLYLAERGTITPYCLKSNSMNLNQLLPSIDDHNLLSLSIEDIYAFFKTQREIDEFSVYSHLKRLGFIITKVEDDDNDNNKITFSPKIEAFKSICGYQLHSLFKQITSLFVSHKNNLFNGLFYNPAHYKYIKYTSTPQIYRNLKLLIPHIEVPKTLPELQHRKQSYLLNKNQNHSNNPLKLTFNVWKPQTNYKKKIPELPDYQIVVYNKNDNKQHFPTNDDLKNIFDSLNYKFEFLDKSNNNNGTINWDDHSYINGIPRSAILSKNQKKKITNSQSETINNTKEKKRKTLRKQPSSLVSSSTPAHIKQIKRLKNGYRSFILAVMDNGIISFIKISEADLGSEDVWYVPTVQAKKIKKPQYQYKKRNIMKQSNTDQKV